MPLAICSTSIDWAATGTMLQGFGTFAGSGAVVWAAHKGASTFDGWRRQKIAERKQVQAERILTASYKARRALSFVRSPFMSVHELNGAEAILSEKDWWKGTAVSRRKRFITAQAYFSRLNHAKAEREELDQCLPMARALFGEDLEKAIEELNRQFWVVHVSAESYIDDEARVDPDFSDKLHRALYEMPVMDDQVNEVTDAISAQVKIIEDTCLPVLRLED